jgi:hypothetical protein
MTGTQEVTEKYTRLLAQEDATRSELFGAEARLQTVDQEDIAAGAQAALAGTPLPARKAIKLKHAVENLRIDLARIDEAIYLLQLEARHVVGEGHADFPIFIPPNALPSRAAVVAEWKGAKVKRDDETDEEFEARIESQIPRSHVDAESIIREAHRQREISLDRRLPRLTERPADLIAWVEAAYERRAKKQRGKDAVAAVERAKGEHQRRGLPAESFRLHSYPEIIKPEHLAEFEAPIARSPFEKRREEQLPSHKPAQNEPVAEPQPVVTEDEERRRREIAKAPPAPTVVAPPKEPVNPDADLPLEERAAARAARLAAATAHLEDPPSQTPIVEEAA